MTRALIAVALVAAVILLTASVPKAAPEKTTVPQNTPQKMTAERLGTIVSAAGTAVKAYGGTAWEFTAGGVRLACICDPAHDRMRIIAPVASLSDVTAEQKDRMLEANFHSALDARYATSDGLVYAAFIHPLSPLQESEVRSAIQQVTTAARTFGDSYSSGELVYGAQRR